MNSQFKKKLKKFLIVDRPNYFRNFKIFIVYYFLSYKGIQLFAVYKKHLFDIALEEKKIERKWFDEGEPHMEHLNSLDLMKLNIHTA